MASPIRDPEKRELSIGDLVRISTSGAKNKKLKSLDYTAVGRIVQVTPDGLFDIEWILGGRSNALKRSDLLWSPPDFLSTSRKRKKPTNYSDNTSAQPPKKAHPKGKPVKSNKVVPKKATKTVTKKKLPSAASKPGPKPVGPKAGTSKKASKAAPKKPPPAPDPTEQEPHKPTEHLYEKHYRELERCLIRLETKIDFYQCFWEEAPPQYDEVYETTTPELNSCSESPTTSDAPEINDVVANNAEGGAEGGGEGQPQTSSSPINKPRKDFPNHPPYNWEMIRRRLKHGRYEVDRLKLEEDTRFEMFADYYDSLGKKRPRRRPKSPKGVDVRVVHPKGINWELFRDDVLQMCESSMKRNTEDGDGDKGSVSWTTNKIREVVNQAVERTGKRQKEAMEYDDDRHKFTLAVVKAQNSEAAMQSWRKNPFPERIYERLTHDAVCAGLSDVDEKIAKYELQTSLPDSFIGQSYRYDDTGQSEAWMKSVVDEANNTKKKKLSMALSADEGVIRAQVTATMQSLLISVMDKVMTEKNVLRQPELQSANWMNEKPLDRKQLSHNDHEPATVPSDDNDERIDQQPEERLETERQSDIVEQPVWGIDCYTRRNILNALQVELEPDIAQKFVDKWLLPAINACPEHLAHDIGNAAELLEFQANTDTVLGMALIEKIKLVGPSWLKPAANQLRRARNVLGLDFFRVHPKGHGSVVLAPSIQPNSLVTFYRGELFPSWRWGEKMDAIEITQTRKHLKPNLPDFYNMALERPQKDPRGYGLLFVDASRKAGHGSSLSHSCDPTCEVRVAALKGELCLAMTTLRELEMGEELTFDYNAVTESLNEYRSAVCLCGYRKCRGSFLHFATADCYQQVLNRNSPIAARFASLVRGSMKQVMSADDEKVLKNHGFLTASFGAISVNRHDAVDGEEKLVDSLDIVPIWLRTYVADTLRYIEYERRALPISLICDHLSSKEEAKSNVAEAKEPRREPSFFYFARTETEFLKNLLKEQGFPMSVNRLQMVHTIKKVASSHWAGLSEEEKQHYKDLATKDYKKKLKEWKSQKNEPAKKRRKGGKPEIDDILHSSTISFQDADAEGVAAMEQRIQQLTQTLSRIGRVLDRHREETYRVESNQEGKERSLESIRDRVQSPLRVLSDEEVVGWMWNSRSGLVQSFIRSIWSCRCSPPTLASAIGSIRCRFSALEAFGDPVEPRPALPVDQRISEPRKLLREALLEMRDAIEKELKEMRKSFLSQTQEKATNVSQLSSEANSMCTDCASDTEIDSVNDSAGVPDPEANDVNCSTARGELHVSDNAGRDDIGDRASGLEHVIGSGEEASDRIPSLTVKTVDLDTSPVEEGENTSWMEFYGKRYTLEAAADVLLLYASTSTFFVLQPYKPLTSTPVEVYARELGNKVPLSVIDVELSEKTSTNTTRDPEGKRGGVSAPSDSDTSPYKQSTSSIDKSSLGNDDDTDGLCAPDDIVAMVSVDYQGDYVLSQLLQWYNGGIGQKAGLPDLLGCILLPRIADCWSSEYASKSSVKPERTTVYSSKVRPALVEWMQDPYSRGNPWPQEISKAFAGTELVELRKNATSHFLPFGSPIVDFLVAGDESNITAILHELDANDRIGKKRSADGLLSSVDKGRPAQAVSTWVQCERPECMKWRKIPWFVDSDLLPDKFFCEDNKWDPLANNCDAPEEDWGNADALVGSDGKVEGSPVKKSSEELLSVHEGESFRIGNRFDVQKSDAEGFRVARVIKTDFSGIVKRIHFHFDRTKSDSDQWIEFGSPRIASLYSKTEKPMRLKKPSSETVSDVKNGEKPRPQKKPKAVPTKEMPKAVPTKEQSKVGPAKEKLNAAPTKEQDKAGPTKEKLKKEKKTSFEARDPRDKSSFVVGGRFDVQRSGQKKFYSAIVRDKLFTDTEQKIKFHYSKTDDSLDEWVDFGSDRICAFNSRRRRNRKNINSAPSRPLSDLAKVIAHSTGRSYDPIKDEDPARQVSDISSRVDSDLTSLGDVAMQGRSHPDLHGSRIGVSDVAKNVPELVESEAFGARHRSDDVPRGAMALQNQQLRASSLTNGRTHYALEARLRDEQIGKTSYERQHSSSFAPSSEDTFYVSSRTANPYSGVDYASYNGHYQDEQSRFASVGSNRVRGQDVFADRLLRAFDGLEQPTRDFSGASHLGVDRYGSIREAVSRPRDFLMNSNATRQALVESMATRAPDFTRANGLSSISLGQQQSSLQCSLRAPNHLGRQESLQLNDFRQSRHPGQELLASRPVNAATHTAPSLSFDPAPQPSQSQPEAPQRPMAAPEQSSRQLSGLDILAAVTNFASNETADQPPPTMLSPQQQQRIRSLVHDGSHHEDPSSSNNNGLSYH